MEIRIRKSMFILSIIGAFLVGVLLMGSITLLSDGHSSGISSQSSEGFSSDEKFDELKNYVDNYYLYDYDENDLKEGAYKGYIRGLGDDYSSYMDAEEYESFMASSTGSYSGVGITFSADGNGNFIVIKINPGSPADGSGIKEGDYLLSIDGKEFTDVEMMASAIRGKAGTKVTIEYTDGKEIKEVTLTREQIELKSVDYKMLDSNVAYIQVDSFLDSTGKDFKNALNIVEKKGAKKLILDLRDNGGGLVNQSVEVADEFLDEGVVCYTEDKNGNTDSYDAEDGKTDIETVVLINGNSASAAEILAAALKDNGFEIVGETSFGKGVIQVTTELRDGSALKLTIMQYLSPDKNVINKKGVKPTVKIKDKEKTETDEQLDKALQILNE